jgi:hypothetical protein
MPPLYPSKFSHAVAVSLVFLAMLCGNVSAVAGVSAKAAKSAPQFSDYPVTEPEQPRTADPVALRLASSSTRRYATLLHQEFGKPANFAGHLRVAQWGCGTDCRNFAVLDLKTGAASTLPHAEEISGVMGNDDERIEFRPDSRLLIISGSINDGTAPGKFYYLWTGKRLQRIGSMPLAVEPIQNP